MTKNLGFEFLFVDLCVKSVHVMRHPCVFVGSWHSSDKCR